MKLEEFINYAIDKLIEKDKYLLENNVNERAITHKLAEHMQHIVGELLDVDCEYNRDIDEDNNIKRRYNSNCNERGYTNVNPDIIVHRRRENINNLIVVEVKKSDAKEEDKNRLKDYTLNKNLNYSYGVYIEFETGKKIDENRYSPVVYYYKYGVSYYKCKGEAFDISVLNK